MKNWVSLFVFLTLFDWIPQFVNPFEKQVPHVQSPETAFQLRRQLYGLEKLYEQYPSVELENNIIQVENKLDAIKRKEQKEESKK